MIPTDVKERIQGLARVFTERGRRLFLVGGSVRDRLLGRDVSDVDLATDAIPEEVKDLAQLVSPDALYLVGQKFGTVGLVFGDTKVEITTFRTEAYRPLSRWPDVAFTPTLEDDLWRRDFTVNAMAQDPLTSEVIDPTGGLGDLENRLLRAVGEPAERFAEDPLRLLRAVRFASQLGFAIEERTAQAVSEQAGMISTVSAERIGEEMNRILLSPHAAHGLRLARELGLLDLIVPELVRMESVPQGPYGPRDALAHSLAALERVQGQGSKAKGGAGALDPYRVQGPGSRVKGKAGTLEPVPLTLRWAALLHDIGKPATFFRDATGIHFYNHQMVGADMASGILSRLRLERRTINTAVKLVRMHMRPLQYERAWSDGAVRRLMVDAGPDLGKLMQLARADLRAHDGHDEDVTLALLAELESRCVSLGEAHDVHSLRSPLDGRELMALFNRGPGPWLNEVKEHLLAHVLDGTLRPDDKDGAERLARAYVDGLLRHGRRNQDNAIN